MSYVSSREAQEFYNVHPDTLRRWAKEDKIKYKWTEGGHRRFYVDRREGRERYIYARVSSKKQEGDLQRQIKYLKRKYPNYEVIQDIGSGLNFERKGFKCILENLFQRRVEEVVVATSDRFSRFGTNDLFKWIFESFGAKLTILGNRYHKSPTEELASDLLEVVTVFTARYHGRRKYKDKES